MSDKLDLRAPFEAHGIFQMPDGAGDKITGRLARGKTGIELTTSPTLKPFDPRRLFQSEELNIPVLHGRTSKGPCTLLGLQSPMEDGLADAGDRQSLVFRKFHVGLCVVGLHLPGIDAPCIESACFGYSGVHEWIPRPGRLATTPEGITLTIPTDFPPVFDLCSLATKSQFVLYTAGSLSSSISKGHSFGLESRLEVEPHRPQSISWFLDLANRFENLFSLLLGTSVVLKNAGLSAADESGWVLRKARSKPQRPDPSVYVRCHGSQLAEAVLRWLSTPEEFRHLENLVYWTIGKSSLFPGTEFLSLAQAVESLHRLTDRSTVTAQSCFKEVLGPLLDEIKVACGDSPLAVRLIESIEHANEPNFRYRVEHLLSRLTGDHCRKLLGDPKDFEQTLRQTRHYYTHLGIKKKAKVITADRDVFLFNQKLHALLRLLMLMHIGLPEDQVFDPVYSQSTKWH